jgi:hypothetical protein
METFSRKLSGTCLLIGAAMAVLTMILHPVGGSMAHIVKIKGVLIFSHALAIACMPLIAFGLWGLSKTLATQNRMAILSLFIAMFGLGAATLAGVINGLVLPQFAANYVGKETNDLGAILNYARLFNKSLAYVFMAAITVAILLWSLLIIARGQLSKWLGYYGLVVFVFGIAALCSTSNMTSVSLFAAFVFGMASWLVAVGILLLKAPRPETMY